MRRTLVVFVGFSLLLASQRAMADEGERAGSLEAPKKETSPGPTVELRANESTATLERRTGTSTLSGLPLPDLSIGGVSQWETACVAPCSLPLSAHYTYRVSGDGRVPTSSFTLPRGRERVTVDADLGRASGRIAGLGLFATGLGAMVLGGAALVASPILSANDVGSTGFRTAVLSGGVAVTSIGAVLVAVGATLWLTNGSSLRLDPSPGVAKGPKLTASGFVF
jgi:hypothetical protein